MRHTEANKTFYRVCKSVFDIVFSALIILVLLLPCLVVCIFVAWDTKAWPIYRQWRMGLHGKEFRIFKFRTMVADADDVEKWLDEAQTAQWIMGEEIKDDPRITTLGKQLRVSGMDEIPTFLNVLLGQMSLLGPTPLPRLELDAWYSDAEQEELLSVRPGMTGPWQSRAFSEFSYLDGTRQELELTYARKACFALDIELLHDACNYPLAAFNEAG
ncbi:MAG: sugar transferase [Atopobiaceae bacterium]|nr:sugar transferase [Atopobiaceae bacterium]